MLKAERSLVLRGIVGGTFMGLANLVPGISGGTMLLACGIYTKFIEAIAEVTSFRFRLTSLLVLGSVGCAAALAILLFAGLVKNLVLDSRWVMYSLFIGLTLGGIPILKNLLGRIEKKLWVSVAMGCLAMLFVSFFQSGEATSHAEASGWVMLFAAGCAGASAMILPGISGGYLLLVMGAYLPILQGIDLLKTGLRTADVNAVMTAVHSVVIPVGLGVVFGIVVVSHLLKWLLHRFPRQTYAALLGLLVGAVFGLWPFQATVPLDTVHQIKAQSVEVWGDILVYSATQKPVDVKDIPMEPYLPGIAQVLMALVIVAVGFGITHLVARFGSGRKEASQP